MCRAPMILEWLADILRKNVAVQQGVCVIISGVKLSLGAQKTGLSTIATASKEYILQER